jgi:hypothetical protein
MAAKEPLSNPYVGPRPFEQRHRDRFFGRDRETGELLSLVIAEPLLLLYAQSGAGKTSLVNAGLVPLLEREGFQVLPTTRVRGLIPPEIDPRQVPNLYAFHALLGWAGDQAEPQQLAQASLAGYLEALERPLDPDGLVAPRVIIVDQFEELLTTYPERWADREGFFRQLAEALRQDPLLRVVLVMREEYIAQLDPYAALLSGGLRTRYRLERLRREAALLAVREPLEGTPRSFAPGVADQLVETLQRVRFESQAGETIEALGEFVEPVQLQVVCSNLWQDLPPGVTVITSDHLRTFGDANQALADFYERSIKRAGREAAVKEIRLRGWFEHDLITPAGTRGTVFRGRTESGGVPNAAVDVLADLHLVRAEWRAGARWYELTHDRLIGPIQMSNEAWHAARRQRGLRRGGAIAALVFLLVVIAAGGLAFTTRERSVAAQATATVTSAEAERLSHIRPLRPGLSVSTQTGGASSIGAFARDARGETYLLLADCVSRAAVLQPGRYDGGQAPQDVIGEVIQCPSLENGASVTSLVGLAQLNGRIAFETEIPGIGPILGIRDPALGMVVRKMGRTTGLTTGTITAVDQSIAIGLSQPGSTETVMVRLTGCIATTPLSEGGDGGALVVDEQGYAVGILVAGSQQGTVLAPIQEVLDRWDLELAIPVEPAP